MANLTLVTPDSATGQAKDLLATVHSQLGRIPNMMRAMASAPPVLDAYLQMSGALAKGTLPAKTRELIALTVGQANECNYCLAAHSTIGASIGLTSDEMLAARSVHSEDANTDALLRFAAAIVEQRGRVLPGDLEAVRTAGCSEAAVGEVIANVALNLFTNYFNHIANVAVDFAAAPALAKAPSLVKVTAS